MAKVARQNTATIEFLTSLGSSLQKEATESPTPSQERCLDLISALAQHEDMSIVSLRQSQIGKILTRSIKSFKRHRRSSSEDWSTLISKSEDILQSWKDAADVERKEAQKKNRKTVERDDSGSGSLPVNTTNYKSRLLAHKKEIYKDPPVLPPPSVAIHPKTFPLPTRDASNRTLTFTGPAPLVIASFHPNTTPEEIIRGGSFGGTYFRRIHSAVTNTTYEPSRVLTSTVSPEWITGLKLQKVLTSSVYDKSVNKFGVKCGGSLGMWESSGWIADCDVYGWFQWYCRFYNGRRCEDDERQIKRWAKCAGEKGRFLSQLCNKILKSGKKSGDVSVSPVIRQTLWHWGLEVDEFTLERHKRRINA